MCDDNNGITLTMSDNGTYDPNTYYITHHGVTTKHHTCDVGCDDCGNTVCVDFEKLQKHLDDKRMLC